MWTSVGAGPFRVGGKVWTKNETELVRNGTEAAVGMTLIVAGLTVFLGLSLACIALFLLIYPLTGFWRRISWHGFFRGLKTSAMVGAAIGLIAVFLGLLGLALYIIISLSMAIGGWIGCMAGVIMAVAFLAQCARSDK